MTVCCPGRVFVCLLCLQHLWPAASSLCMTLSAVSLLFSCWSILAGGTKNFFHWGQNLLLAALAIVTLKGDNDDDDDDLPTRMIQAHFIQYNNVCVVYDMNFFSCEEEEDYSLETQNTMNTSTLFWVCTTAWQNKLIMWVKLNLKKYTFLQIKK